MSEQFINGDGKVILTRLTEIDRRLLAVETSLVENLKFHRDHPLCPAPGMCIRLENQIKNNADEIGQLALRLDETRRLVWLGAGIVTVISLLFGVVAPFIITHLLNKP
jgi:hypothetical protein